MEMSKQKPTVSKMETATLTEQYYNGTLPCGFYYFTNGKDVYPIDYHAVKGPKPTRCKTNPIGIVCEMPTYDQFVELTKKVDHFSQLVKKVEELERKLMEANQTIKDIREAIRKGEFPCDACGYSMECEGCWCGDIADSYLEKWGVK